MQRTGIEFRQTATFGPFGDYYTVREQKRTQWSVVALSSNILINDYIILVYILDWFIYWIILVEVV